MSVAAEGCVCVCFVLGLDFFWCRSAARLNAPAAIIGDSSSLLIVDRVNHAVRRLHPSNLTFAATTLAGVVGSLGSTGNGGQASSARLNNPSAIASDGAGGWLIVRDILAELRGLLLSRTHLLLQFFCRRLMLRMAGFGGFFLTPQYFPSQETAPSHRGQMDSQVGRLGGH